MSNFIFVFLGGGCGALLRYGASLLSLRLFNLSWYGTLFVNLLGSIILFYLTKKGLDAFSIKLDLFLKVGLLGALTTYSTFCLEVVTFMRTGDYKSALLVFILNMFLGVIAGVMIFRSEII